MSRSIIDGHYNLHRSVRMGENMNTTSSGVYSGGVYIFLRTLHKVLEHGKPIVVFDTGRAEYRTELYPEYKKRPERSEEEKLESSEFDDKFDTTYSIVQKILPRMGIPVVTLPRQEGDDVIYRLAEHLSEKEKITVISDDSDYYQFVNIPNCNLYRPMKDEFYNKSIFNEKFGFPSEYFAMYKAIMGDGSDNIPGIKGIGPANATKIVKMLKEPTISCLYEWAHTHTDKNAIKVKESFSIVKRNLLLVDLSVIPLTKEEVALAYNTSMETTKLDFNYVVKMFNFLEFTTMGMWLAELQRR